MNHRDNLNAWLYGVRQGTIPETRYLVLPDDNIIARFNAQWHQACISQGGVQQNAGVTWANNNQAANIDGHASILQQLTTTISAQKGQSNWIKQSPLQQDPTPSQPRRIKERSYPKDTPKHNQDGLQGGRLVLHRWNRNPPSNLLLFHWHRKCGNGSIGFSPSIQRTGVSWRHLCIRNNKGFLYADSSTPSNFTIFAFHEQEPNSDNRQQDYLICHPIQVEGQKKSLEEIKASLKQSVHVPSDFNGLGTQIQLFGAALTIFFGEYSVCTSSLNQLLTMIGRIKKSFQDQNTWDNFLPENSFLRSTNEFNAGWGLARPHITPTLKSMTGSSNSKT
jgi:hypothetical protein